MAALLGVGSFPLARGLRRKAVLVEDGEWIIPARAGFTWGRRRSWERRTDHPRSRGVYAPIEGASVGRQGSSPLARGLLVGALGEGEPGLDHPRSRGVYGARAHGGHALVGSSPLARGLPVVEKLADWFTGSSPLARGLRCLRDHRQDARRIIPARAGFTISEAHSGPPPRDHPRSRGVYPRAGLVALWAGGSSPLARGLPVREASRPRRWRIIPARAGFTRTRARGGHLHRDHPRSRGVYPRRAWTRSAPAGSSPLARGLQRWWFIALVIVGIIPARAGFTDRPGRTHREDRDHPRSRGVYPCGTRTARSTMGSSPLARGLQPRQPGADVRPGIIPARAGFTHQHHGEHAHARDHPRSRGVYLPTSRAGAASGGSSPLARGLLD